MGVIITDRILTKKEPSSASCPAMGRRQRHLLEGRAFSYKVKYV